MNETEEEALLRQRKADAYAVLAKLKVKNAGDIDMHDHENDPHHSE